MMHIKKLKSSSEKYKDTTIKEVFDKLLLEVSQSLEGKRKGG